MKDVIVVGAGMAGLLAAGILRKNCRMVLEAQTELPNNHSAVLRFRSTAVGDALNIPFKEVSVLKTTVPWRNSLADAVSYSAKTNGTISARSILSATGVGQRFIAPEDLVQQMADRVECQIAYGTKADFEALQLPAISTIPMPLLMGALGWERADRVRFRHRKGVNVVAKIKQCEMYATAYLPDPGAAASRVSITGDLLIGEFYGSEVMKQFSEDREGFTERAISEMLHAIGVSKSDLAEGPVAKEQKFAKILPIDEQERREFILWASEVHNIYSLGRFATWRPGLLLDDVVNDVSVICRLIENRAEAYAHRLKG